MSRDRLFRIVVGIAIGAVVGFFVMLNMQGSDTTWSFGPHQPLFAGILVCVALATLVAVTSPKKAA